MKIEKFEDLDAWKEARKLVRCIYGLTKSKPFCNDYALRDQIIRASISTMANIAEGFDSGFNPQFIQFLLYSRRSASEVQSELYIALDNKYISESEFERSYVSAETVRKLCSGLITYLRNYKTNSKRQSNGQ